MPIEKRRSSRFNVDLDASFRKLSQNSSAARIQNMSSGGAFLLARDAPKLGEVVQLQYGRSMEFVGSVVHVVDLPNQITGFAVQFLTAPKNHHRRDKQAGGRKNWAQRPDGIHHEAFDYYDNLGKVQDFVYENFTDDVSLDCVARVASLEKTYFSRYFHDKVGISYRDWLQWVRVQRAIELMSKSDQTITEAAYAVGFSDLRSFERTFKKWTSMVPRDFKKLVAPS